MLHMLRWATFDGWPYHGRHTIDNAFRDSSPPGSRRWNRRYLPAGPTPSDAPREMVTTSDIPQATLFATADHLAPDAGIGDICQLAPPPQTRHGSQVTRLEPTMLHMLRWATFDGWPHNLGHTIGNAFRDSSPPGFRRWNRRCLPAGPTRSDAPRDLLTNSDTPHATLFAPAAHLAPEAGKGFICQLTSPAQTRHGSWFWRSEPIMLHMLRCANFDGWPHHVRHTIDNAFRDSSPPVSRRWNRRYLPAGPTPSDAPREMVTTSDIPQATLFATADHLAPDAGIGDICRLAPPPQTRHGRWFACLHPVRLRTPVFTVPRAVHAPACAFAFWLTGFAARASTSSFPASSPQRGGGAANLGCVGRGGIGRRRARRAW